jgi:hypothetical protein
MIEQDQASAEPTPSKAPRPMPVTPSRETQRPEGLAFDVAKGADLSGVPVGDQTPRHPGAARTAQVVRETGAGVGLAVPGDPDRNAARSPDDEASQA